MGAVASQIFLQHVHFGPFYVCSIVSRPTTTPIWQIFQVLLVYFDHMHIWKVLLYLGVETMVQFLFLMLWQPISEWHFWAWKYDMLAEMQFCVLEASIRDHDPWFIPYGYKMDDWVVFWCTMLVLEPKEKLFILLFTKPHWRICEIKMIPIRITLVES